MASALSTFTDFVDTTGPSFLTSAEDVVNEACKNNYLMRRFMRGNGPSESVQGGSKIKDTIMFDDSSTFQYYEPNETFTWQNPQVVENWEIDWRFCVDHMVFTDAEVELNLGGGLGRAARHHAFKRLKRIKEQRLWTSILNGMEDQLFSVPSTADMEASTGTKPYSLPAFVNEESNGLFTASTGTADNFSTVQGLDPATYTKWVPQQEAYDSALVDNDGNIISTFDKMFLDVQFVPPPSHQEYFDDPTLNAMFIACSKKGQNIYTQLLRESQDTFVTASRQDPAYMAPKYAGIDLVYAPTLDTYAGYPGLSTEGDATAQGPRYYFLNGNFIKYIFHQSRYMMQHPTMRHPNQPFTSIVPVDSWYNFVCRSRQRQGIVYPTGTPYTYTA